MCFGKKSKPAVGSNYKANASNDQLTPNNPTANHSLYPAQQGQPQAQPQPNISTMSQPPYDDSYTAPPSHSPSEKWKEPQQPYHDWAAAVPDTSDLPPPPVIKHFTSPFSNASYNEAARAHKYDLDNPKWAAHSFDPEQLSSIDTGALQLIRPQEYKGDLTHTGPGRYTARTARHQTDAALVSALPIYSALAHSPLRTERSKTIYFEVRFTGQSTGPAECGLAIGYVAQPYPTWRLPGWQRGSLGVHSDDGRRYIDDPDGGIDFTEPFEVGQTLGLGMTFSVPKAPPAYEGEVRCDVEVFFTRNGKKTDGWNLFEEVDSKSNSRLAGIDGSLDICAAVGTFGGLDFEVCFAREGWLYQPSFEKS